MSLREHHFRFLWSDSIALAFCLDASIGVFTFASITGDRGATVGLTAYRRASCTSERGLKNVLWSHDLATTTRTGQKKQKTKTTWALVQLAFQQSPDTIS